MKYKQLIVLLICLPFGSQNIRAQEKGEFSIEANLFRVAENSGLNGPGSYWNEALWLNGVNFGYNLSRKFRPYVDFNYNNTDLKGYPEELEKLEKDYRLGVDFTFNPQDRFNVILGGHYFYRTMKLKGAYITDAGPFEFYPINHEATDRGGAILLGLKFQLNKNIYVYSKSRFGVGKYSLEANSGVDTPLTYDSYDDVSSYEEPIESLGVAFKF